MKKCKNCNDITYRNTRFCRKCMTEYQREWARKNKNRRCQYCNKFYVPNSIEKECSIKCKFMNKTIINNSCWEWQGKINKWGYGETSHNSKTYRCNRLSYIIFKGDIPKGMQVCHTCDNRKCVNPEHLWLGTPKENMQDAVKKNRMPREKRNKSSKLTYEQVKDIIRLLENGEKQTNIAKLYNVCQSTISNVKLKLFYKEAVT